MLIDITSATYLYSTFAVPGWVPVSVVPGYAGWVWQAPPRLTSSSALAPLTGSRQPADWTFGDFLFRNMP